MRTNGRTWSYQATRRPLKKWTTKEISAITNKMWISPLAAWNAKNPSSHITSKTTNSVRNIKISFVRSGLSPVTPHGIEWPQQPLCAMAEAKRLAARV
jgi:hypothetical protein